MSADVKASLEFGDCLQEFMMKLTADEGIPKEIRDRTCYTYIYIRDFVVDQVCLVGAKDSSFKRFLKGTDFNVECKRIWIKPKKQYLVQIGDVKLDKNKLYIIQVKPNYEFSVYVAYDPPSRIPHKGAIDRKPV